MFNISFHGGRRFVPQASAGAKWRGTAEGSTVSQTQDRAGVHTERAAAAVTGTLAVASLAALVCVWLVARYVSAQPPLPGRPQQDAFTVYVSGIADLIARLASAVTLGCLAGVAFFVRPAPSAELSASGRRLARTAAHAAQVWAWSSVLLTFANSAFVNGVPMGYTLRPDAWWTFQSATPSGLAWLFSAIVAFACAAVGYASRRVAAYALALVAGAVALVFVAVTGNVTVGANHDWATDASVWLTLAVVGLVSTATAVLLLGHGKPAAIGRRVRRYQRLVPWFAVPALVGIGVVGWQQLAGESPLASTYGWTVLAQGGLLVALLLTWAVRQLSGVRGLRWVLIDGVLLVGWLAVAASANHLVTPRFTVPQSIQINYLGYEVPTPVSFARLVGLGRPNWLWVALSVAAIVAYLWGVARLRRRGGSWSPGRTLPWVAGWVLMLALAVTGFWEYSTVAFSWHMFVHMTVNMLVPVLCVLGGPITLVRAASLDRSADLPGPRELSLAIESSRPVNRLFSPPVLWVNYIASLFLIYFTPLFPWLMRYHWAHQLMLLYFMATGYAFFNLIVGIDRQRSELPHLVKLAMVISIMPFHAIFAVGIMSAKTLIGADFYRAIAVPWIPDLLADQNIAGQITWILGEIPLFVVMVALAAQWFSHDRAENAVSDIAQDSGTDDSFDAYNDMLAQLANRDRDGARGRRP